jgi:hypothetical protein
MTSTSRLNLLFARVRGRLLRAVMGDQAWIGRAACLGADVFKLHVQDHPRALMLNQQKVRIDLLAQWLAGAPRPRAAIVKEHLHRADVLPLIEQQEQLPWLSLSEKPAGILMDSFAELTDQQFVHRQEGWSFCCHYSDLVHSPAFESRFECRGLMPVEQFEPGYRAFFRWIERQWPGVPVVYLHFPTTLDSREVFRQRGRALVETLDLIAREMPFVRPVAIPDEQVTRHEGGDDFAYHYGAATYQSFLREWRRLDGSRP